MNRQQWFADVARFGPGRLPWIDGMSPDGCLILNDSATDSWWDISDDTQDTDPDACVFVRWALEWLKEYGLREVVSDDVWRVFYHGPKGTRVVSDPSLLDAAGTALASVLAAMEVGS